MLKNVSSQKIAVFAFDTTTGAPKTGDAANISVYVDKDWAGTAQLTDTSATEIDATNAKGWYLFDLAQAETNADALLFSGKSSTANITVVGQLVFTVPPNFTAQSIDSNGRVDAIKIAGTTQTARDLGASVLLSNGTGAGQLKLASGYVAMTLADIAAPTSNSQSGITLGILWYGTLSAIANGTVTLPASNGLDHAGNYAIVLVSGTNATGKSRFLTYSGSGEVWNVDPAWNSDSETLPSGTIVAYITPAPKLPTTSIPTVNTVQISGAVQTARDLGASVLISSGSGTGQLDVTSGVIKANLAQILGTALTETAGLLAGGFKKFFNIATPASTMDALTLVATATNLTNAPGAGDLTSTMKTSVANAVLDATASAHNTALTIGNKINSAASAGDPLSNSVPGAYGAGTAGYLIGTNLDAQVSTRSTLTAANIWDALTSGISTVGSVGKRIVDFLTGDAYVRLGAPAGASHAADVAAVKTDTAAIKTKTDNLPANTTTTLATLQADTDDIQTRLPSVLVGGRMDSSVGSMATDVVNANALAADASTEIVTAIFARAFGADYSNRTFDELIKVIASGMAGKASGLDTGAPVFRSLADTKNVISATTDASGNRSAVTLNP